MSQESIRSPQTLLIWIRRPSELFTELSNPQKHAADVADATLIQWKNSPVTITTSTKLWWVNWNLCQIDGARAVIKIQFVWPSKMRLVSSNSVRKRRIQNTADDPAAVSDQSSN